MMPKTILKKLQNRWKWQLYFLSQNYIIFDIDAVYDRSGSFEPDLPLGIEGGSLSNDPGGSRSMFPMSG